VEKGRTVGEGSRIVLAAYHDLDRVQARHEVVAAVDSDMLCMFAAVAKKLAGGCLARIHDAKFNGSRHYSPSNINTQSVTRGGHGVVAAYRARRWT
jgi:hypothetical protein